ncbi:MAG: hypothetical protein KAH32_06950 [Chlamydiia bacterium]|nr:hypothetical protein [Chlamydiia bacterium]
MAINPSNNTLVNWARVKLLLMENESRGRHSTGIYTNEISKKVVQNASMFIKSLKLTNEQLTNSPVLGHTRAPSIGANRTITGAQPIVEIDDEGNETFAIIHNGTIYNIEELAAEDDEITFEATDTDTQILSKFIQQEKYDVLNKYFGTASLIWHRKDDPTATYVFRGESSSSKHTKFNTEERPLHVGHDATGKYFSSTKDSLVNMFDTKEAKDSVQAVEANKVLRFENGTESVIFTADRSEVFQTKPVVETNYGTHSNSNHNNNSTGYGNCNSNTHRRYNETADRYGYGNYHDDNSTADNLIILAAYDRVEYNGQLPNWISSIPETDPTKLLTTETIKVASIEQEQVFFYKGRYRVLRHLLSGTNYISDEGKLVSQSHKTAKPYAFINGVILKKTTDFVKIYAKVGRLIFGSQSFCDAIADYADQPVPVLEEYGEILIESFTFKGKLLTGVYKPLFTKRGIIEFHSGYLATSLFHPASTINIGDTVRTQTLDKFEVGKVQSTNPPLGFITILTQYDKLVRVDESHVINVMSPITIVKTAEMLEKEKQILKINMENNLKLTRLKTLTDVQSIIEDAHEELHLGLIAADEAKAIVPALQRKIFSLMEKSVSQSTSNLPY